MTDPKTTGGAPVSKATKATKATAKKAPSPDPIAVEDDKPYRPSDLAKEIAEYAKAEGLDVKDVDPARYLRERGLPNPLKRYRVTARRGGEVTPAREVESVDESDAVRQYYRLAGIKEPHRYTAQVFLLED